MGLFKFRKELIENLVSKNINVYFSIPNDEYVPRLEQIGGKYVPTEFDRRGSNPVTDLKLLISYIKIINEIKPDLVLTYTIKPNIYGGIATRICKVKAIHTVTGLGSIFIQKMWIKNVVVCLNRIAFINASLIVFLNSDNREFYKEIKIINKNHRTLIVPGSGVNLNKFKYTPQTNFEIIKFTFIGRILKDKGIEEYLTAAKEICKKRSNIEFQVVGFVEDHKYEEILRNYETNGVIKFFGKRDDIFEIITQSSCIVLPSYGEGRGTVLQEGAAVGRPLIACNTYGCNETVINEFNGYLCQVADSNSLIDAMEKFICLPKKEKYIMGLNSRIKAENEFNRNIIIQTYIKSIFELL